MTVGSYKFCREKFDKKQVKLGQVKNVKNRETLNIIETKRKIYNNKNHI